MHLILIVTALAAACCVRLKWSVPSGNWARRWERSLLFFLFPPLLLLATAIAVIFMGTQGQMVRLWDGWFSYLLAVTFLLAAAILCIKLATDGYIFLKQIRTCPLKQIAGKNVRILDTPALFSAIIGFWSSEFAVSTGLLKTLDSAHLQAVIAHEQAHYYYRDTFWFFWLGWLRKITVWLPNTQALWEELLTLRELRADAKAAAGVDALLLAEALLLVASYPHRNFDVACVIGAVGSQNRLGERIEALLADPEPVCKVNKWFLAWLILTLLPLLSVPFHS
ncbi:M56 family metallopeptidase [Microcoleus sp. ARI1-B5]|uniref:M56 family metallopeptidase n=1 Tax=unclassified Microcoleus TaxID=2642155 RepID=UPI002FD76AC2